jgi:hypothetical protein
MAISKIVTNSVDSGVTITSPTIASPTISAPVLSGSATGTYTIAGTYTLAGTPTAGASLITSGTAVASTSGTSINFTGIPSWVKRITVMFSGVSCSGASNLLVQLGTGGTPTYTTSGYISTSNGGTVGSSTAGFIVWEDTPSQTFSGAMTIFNISGNVWVQSHAGKISTTSCVHGGGDVSLGAVLTAVRITRVNGTDTFDAGSINILYE